MNKKALYIISLVFIAGVLIGFSINQYNGSYAKEYFLHEQYIGNTTANGVKYENVLLMNVSKIDYKTGHITEYFGNCYFANEHEINPNIQNNSYVWMQYRPDNLFGDCKYWIKGVRMSDRK